MLDDHDARILAIHRDADAAVLALGQAVAGQLGPRRAGVGALPERAAGAAAVEAERGAAALIRRGIQHIRIERIHRHIGDAGVVVDVQRALPRLAAVHRAIEAALAAGSPHRSLRRDIDDRRVRRVRDDAADVHRGLEADVGPRLRAVGGLVDAVAPAHALPIGALTGADPDDVRIGLVDRDVADRVHRFALEHRRPRHAVVGGAIHPARRRCDIHDEGV